MSGKTKLSYNIITSDNKIYNGANGTIDSINFAEDLMTFKIKAIQFIYHDNIVGNINLPQNTLINPYNIKDIVNVASNFFKTSQFQLSLYKKEILSADIANIFNQKINIYANKLFYTLPCFFYDIDLDQHIIDSEYIKKVNQQNQNSHYKLIITNDDLCGEIPVLAILNQTDKTLIYSQRDIPKKTNIPQKFISLLNKESFTDFVNIDNYKELTNKIDQLKYENKNNILDVFNKINDSIVIDSTNPDQAKQLLNKVFKFCKEGDEKYLSDDVVKKLDKVNNLDSLYNFIEELAQNKITKTDKLWLVIPKEQFADVTFAFGYLQRKNTLLKQEVEINR